MAGVKPPQGNPTRGGAERGRFRRADLRWADLFGANLSGADLSEANLNGADLNYANLHGTGSDEVDDTQPPGLASKYEGASGLATRALPLRVNLLLTPSA